MQATGPVGHPEDNKREINERFRQWQVFYTLNEH